MLKFSSLRDFIQAAAELTREGIVFEGGEDAHASGRWWIRCTGY